MNRRRALRLLFALVLAPLAACGRKADPERPPPKKTEKRKPAPAR